MKMTAPSLMALAGLILLGSLVVVANTASAPDPDRPGGRDQAARAAAVILEARRNPGDRLY